MVSLNKRRFRLLALAALMSMFTGPASAQEDDSRPAGVTFLGDTGLWFVPTAEVVPDGGVLNGHKRPHGYDNGQSGDYRYGVLIHIPVFIHR